MLVHSTAWNDVQARYEFLLKRQIAHWKESLLSQPTRRSRELIRLERDRLVGHGIGNVSDHAFLAKLGEVLRESTVWLVNSAADVNRVDWNVAPIHILVGGNKLDRGFTVEGLTVTYMNRPASPQVGHPRAASPCFRLPRRPLAVLPILRKQTYDPIAHRNRSYRRGSSCPTPRSYRGWRFGSHMVGRDRATASRWNDPNSLERHPLSPRKRLAGIPTDAVTLPGDTQHNLNLLKEIGLLCARDKYHGRLKFRTIS